MLTVIAHAQHQHKVRSKEAANLEAESLKMGRPTFELAAEGMHLRLWLMSQEEHERLMAYEFNSRHPEGARGEQDKSLPGKMDSRALCAGMVGGERRMSIKHHEGEADKQSEKIQEAAIESMMAGTHHVMVKVSEVESDETVEDAEVELQITSPKNETFALELMNMKDHSCSGLTLKEKGVYGISTSINIDGRTHVGKFQYVVN